MKRQILQIKNWDSLRPAAEAVLYMVAMVTACSAPFPSGSEAYSEGTSPAGGPREVERKKRGEEGEGERESRGCWEVGVGARRTSRGITPAAGVKGINQTE